MNEQEKELVIKDLCGRLPYGVKIKEEYGDYINVNIHNANIEHLIDRVVSGLDKMVLRPLSSMTDEEREEYSQFIAEIYGCACFIDPISQMEWLDKNMFDYRELIPKGLALEAPEGLYD